MYIGSAEIHEADMHVVGETATHFEQRRVRYTPALLKMVDEILVNAIDHHIHYPDAVSSIDIVFKGDVVQISNNGPGIGVVLVRDNTGRELYKPEAILTLFHSGDNFRKQRRTTGGCNGLGAKCTNAFSKSFRITTDDGKLHYVQTFRDRLEIIESATITPSTGTTGTTIAFRPAYVELGYTGKYALNDELRGDFMALIRARAYQAAAYAPKCRFSFNGEAVPISGFQQFAAMFVDDTAQLVPMTLRHSDPTVPPISLIIAPSDGKAGHVSIINGIWAYRGGSHITHIQDQLKAFIRPKLEEEIKRLKSTKKYTHNLVLNRMFIMVCGVVFNPKFDSQTKAELSMGIEVLAEYKLNDADMLAAWTMLKKPILADLYDKLRDKKARVKSGPVMLEKGEDAFFAEHKTEGPKTTLIICEGDSALELIREGINSEHTDLRKEYYGTFSIQGVPTNVSRKVSGGDGDEDDIIRSDELKKSKRYNDLARMLGLDYGKKYKQNAEGDREFATLRYGRVVIAVDQDLDGKGQIFGLLMNFFMTFWPALIARGFISRFNTPIIRAYPKTDGRVLEFYTLTEFRNWIAVHFGGVDERAAAVYSISYYKGLAGHTDQEIAPTFRNFDNKLIRHTLDDEAKETFNVYFGKSSALRKAALMHPPEIEEIVEAVTPVSMALRVDTHEYQRYNNCRKIPSSMDGLILSRRKVLFAARAMFRSSNKKRKVAEFVGEAINMTRYQHGPDSMSGSAICMARRCVGGQNLPALIGLGRFGSRRCNEGGDPRYVSIKLNAKLTDLLYPAVDDALLPYKFDEGVRCEPEYYLPILPMAVLENFTLPATGWKVELWARDIHDVLREVRALIEGKIKRCRRLRTWMRDNGSEVRVSEDGKEYQVGKCTYDCRKETITVHELPTGTFNDTYITALLKKYSVAGPTAKSALQPTLIRRYDDKSCYNVNTNRDPVNIIFYVDPEYVSKMRSSNELMTPMECGMNLGVRMAHAINMITPDGRVNTFAYYETVVNQWFDARKELYGQRVGREIVLIRLRIRLMEQLIRYGREQEGYGIGKRTTKQQVSEILEQHGYPRIDSTLLNSPKYTPTDALEATIINGVGASYKYITDLRVFDLVQDACMVREEKKLPELRAELERLLAENAASAFPGQLVWLRELAELEKVIERGLAAGWDPPTKKHTFGDVPSP